MPLVRFEPSGKQVSVASGVTIKEAARMAEIDLDSPCGGRGRCGKCRVRILSGDCPIHDGERRHLSQDELDNGVRLACVQIVETDITVEVTSVAGWDAKSSLLKIGGALENVPHVRKVFVELPLPSLEDQRSDLERLESAAGLNGYKISLQLLRRIPGILRKAGFRVTLVLSHDEILSVEPGDTRDRLLGMAFDIGTTTVVGYLLDLTSGRELSAASTLNPQVTYGADVISRISFAMQDESNVAHLQSAILNALNGLIQEAADKAGVSPSDIYTLTVVGNTCMHHLFLGLDPTNIGVHPYVPVTAGPLTVKAQELGIKVNECAMVYVLPNIAGFVGADTVAVAIAQDMEKRTGINLAVDIGTNGEMILGNSGKLLSCSTAAGPAFEGAHIACGMRAAPGAIDHVWLDDDGNLCFSVIGRTKPTGICGSGLIDTVAALLESGIVAPTGEIRSPDRVEHPVGKRLSERIVMYNDAKAFVLADKDVTEHGRPILITQRDIRELQLSKGAISAGIQVLMAEMGISPQDIDNIFVAGAFGNYLDPASAVAIGLFPRELADRIKLVGNAAGAGAMKALVSRHEYERAADVARQIGYVELAAHPMFRTVFTRAMGFPSV